MVRIMREALLEERVIFGDLGSLLRDFFGTHSGGTSGMVLRVIEFDLLIGIFVYNINLFKLSNYKSSGLY